MNTSIFTLLGFRDSNDLNDVSRVKLVPCLLETETARDFWSVRIRHNHQWMKPGGISVQKKRYTTTYNNTCWSKKLYGCIHVCVCVNLHLFQQKFQFVYTDIYFSKSKSIVNNGTRSGIVLSCNKRHPDYGRL